MTGFQIVVGHDGKAQLRRPRHIVGAVAVVNVNDVAGVQFGNYDAALLAVKPGDNPYLGSPPYDPYNPAGKPPPTGLYNPFGYTGPSKPSTKPKAGETALAWRTRMAAQGFGIYVEPIAGETAEQFQARNRIAAIEAARKASANNTSVWGDIKAIVGGTVKSLAPFAQMVLSVVPGIGPGISAALAAGFALAQGQSVTAALMAGVRGALPGGPLAGAAFDVGVSAVTGKPVTATAIAALPISAAQKTALTKVAPLLESLANGEPPTAAVLAEIDKAVVALPTDVRTALQTGVAVSSAQVAQQGGASMPTTTTTSVVVRPARTTTTMTIAVDSARLPSLAQLNFDAGTPAPAPATPAPAPAPVRPPPLKPEVALSKDYARALTDKETVNEWYGAGVTSLIAIARDAWNKDETAKAQSASCKQLVSQAAMTKAPSDITKANEALDAINKRFVDFVAKRIRAQADAARASSPTTAEDKAISDNESKANKLLQAYMKDGWLAEQRKAVPVVASIGGRPIRRGLLLVTSGERAGRIYFDKGAFIQVDGTGSAVLEGLLLSTDPATLGTIDATPKKYIPINA